MAIQQYDECGAFDALDSDVEDEREEQQRWRAAHQQLPADLLDENRQVLLRLFRTLQAAAQPGIDLNEERLARIVRCHPRRGGGFFSKDLLLSAYRDLCRQGELSCSPHVERWLRMKPIRTLSGVVPVTVLTRPGGCSGQCVFCPRDPQAPKSYLSREPGVMRARMLNYDPYRQTATRLQALHNIGHSTDKVELLILGGSWSHYPADYRAWFVRRCLDALLPADPGEGGVLDLPSEASILRPEDEDAPHPCVGITVETRPDAVDPAELLHMRRLGVTRVQLGVQSLDDELLRRNGRGHTLEQTRGAVRLLRLAGFKLVLHWMPNLLGATPEGDLADFGRLWSDPALQPDELKLYPCLLVPGTELYARWEAGEYAPYPEPVLVELLARCKALIPPTCRVDRLMRDIPAGYVAAGTRKSNLRQLVHAWMDAHGTACRCIRCREVRGSGVHPADLRPRRIDYPTDVTDEAFLSFETPEGRLAAFLRLSLPRGDGAPVVPVVEELRGAAVVRELHVYGPALGLGARDDAQPQHGGLGARLLAWAGQVAREQGHRRLAVIAAVGTRPYYRRFGFELGELYMHRELTT